MTETRRQQLQRQQREDGNLIERSNRPPSSQKAAQPRGQQWSLPVTPAQSQAAVAPSTILRPAPVAVQQISEQTAASPIVLTLKCSCGAVCSATNAAVMQHATLTCVCGRSISLGSTTSSSDNAPTEYYDAQETTQSPELKRQLMFSPSMSQQPVYGQSPGKSSNEPSNQQPTTPTPAQRPSFSGEYSRPRLYPSLHQPSATYRVPQPESSNAPRRTEPPRREIFNATLPPRGYKPPPDNGVASPRRARTNWTRDQEEALDRAMRRLYHRSKLTWKSIMFDPEEKRHFIGRTPQDLRDKARNIRRRLKSRMPGGADERKHLGIYYDLYEIRDQ